MIRDVIKKITEGFSLNQKSDLRKELTSSRGKFLNIKSDGSWTIDELEKKVSSSFKVDDILDYYGWRYNVKTSISVAFKDIEKGIFDFEEVGR